MQDFHGILEDRTQIFKKWMKDEVNILLRGLFFYRL